MTGTAMIIAGTLVATLCAYAFQLLGGRALGPADFAPLTILWTVQFVVMHVLYQPLEQYAIRQIELRRTLDRRFLLVAVAVATALSALFVALTLDRLFDGDRAYIAVTACMTSGYALFCLTRARLAGTRRFEAYGFASAAEGVLRLAAAAAILAVSRTAASLAWAMALAPLAVLPWLGRFPPAEGRERAHRLVLPMVGGSVSAQLLIGAAPVAAAFLGAGPATISVVFVTFALLRAPLWILNGLAARILPILTAMVRDGQDDRLRTWSRRLVAFGLGSAAVSGLLAAAVGPTVVAWLFGPAFRPSAAMTGLVGAGVVLATAGLLTNQVLLAAGHTGYITVAWTCALVVAAGALALPAPVEVTLGVAFLLGQIVAIALLGRAVARVIDTAGRSAHPLDATTVTPTAHVVPGPRSGHPGRR